jgi:hypothetical protein
MEEDAEVEGRVKEGGPLTWGSVRVMDLPLEKREGGVEGGVRREIMGDRDQAMRGGEGEERARGRAEVRAAAAPGAAGERLQSRLESSEERR